MAEMLHWLRESPSLRRPVLIVALDGFVDAGAAASTASAFLRHRWLAEPVAEFDADALIDYRARRPTAVLDNGVLRRLQWPELQLLTAHVQGPRDAVFLLGPEPDMRWHAFVEAVADACHHLGVELVIGLGAYPAAAPHTRPVNIVKATNTATAPVRFDAEEVTGYTGPVGAGTALQAALAERSLPAVGLWAEIPHYISGSPYPPGALALVRLVASALETRVDTTELEAAAKLHLEQVNEAIAEHEEAAAMISGLERMSDAEGDEQSLPTGEDLANEIERFLRAQPDE